MCEHPSLGPITALSSYTIEWNKKAHENQKGIQREIYHKVYNGPTVEELSSDIQKLVSVVQVYSL